MFCRTASLSVTISFFAHRICVYVLVGLMFEVQSIGGDASLFARIGFVPTGSLPHGRGPYPAILLSVLFAQEIQQLQRRNEQVGHGGGGCSKFTKPLDFGNHRLDWRTVVVFCEKDHVLRPCLA